MNERVHSFLDKLRSVLHEEGKSKEDSPQAESINDGIEVYFPHGNVMLKYDKEGNPKEEINQIETDDIFIDHFHIK